MQGARAPQPGVTNRPSPSGPFTVPSAPDRSQECRFLERCAAPRAPCERLPALKQPAPQRPPGAGGPGGRGTPGPIPNPEVKPASADGTAGATLWETRAPPAPGARCAGSGRGGAREAPGEGDPRGSPFSYMSAMCASIPHIYIQVHFCSLTMPGNADAILRLDTVAEARRALLWAQQATLIRSRRILRQSVL